jgi:hypothetical protein
MVPFESLVTATDAFLEKNVFKYIKQNVCDPHPHLVPKVLDKSRAIPLLTLRAFVG